MSANAVDPAIWVIIGTTSLVVALLFAALAFWRVSSPSLPVRVASSLAFIGLSLGSVAAIDAAIVRTFPPRGIYVDLGLLHLFLPTLAGTVVAVLVARKARSQRQAT
jgi:hypothetical protein